MDQVRLFLRSHIVAQKYTVVDHLIFTYGQLIKPFLELKQEAEISIEGR
jgi:hypothetical protein